MFAMRGAIIVASVALILQLSSCMPAHERMRPALAATEELAAIVPVGACRYCRFGNCTTSIHGLAAGITMQQCGTCSINSTSFFFSYPCSSEKLCTCNEQWVHNDPPPAPMMSPPPSPCPKSAEASPSPSPEAEADEGSDSLFSAEEELSNTGAGTVW